jgi:hypothetical protein
MMTMRTFLSYDSRDANIAEQLLPRLVAQKLDVWDPSREIYPGSNWLLEMGRALERADGIVFLISENSAESAALLHQVEYAVSNIRFKDRVVPIILSRNVKNVPWILNKMSVIDAADHDMERVAKLVATAMRRPRKGSPSRQTSTRSNGAKRRAVRASKTRH